MTNAKAASARKTPAPQASAPPEPPRVAPASLFSDCGGAPCPEPVLPAATPEQTAALTDGVRMRENPAEWAFVRLSKLSEDFEKGLDKEAKPYSSMAKNHVANVLCNVLDDAIQMHGSLGYSEDLPFSQWYRFARAARIADGPDEVHTVVVARDFLRGALTTLV